MSKENKMQSYEKIPKSLILSYIPDEEVHDFKLKLNNLGFREKKSQIGMVMVKAKDCFDVEFFLGEVLVAEAYVDFENTIGYGMIVGLSTDRAFILACNDALDDIKNDSLKSLIESWFLENSKYFKEHYEQERAFFKSTKVNFGLMVEG